MNDEELWAQQAHDERSRIREERDRYREKYLEQRAELDQLRADLAAMTKERDDARAQVRWFVEKVADEKLDGYRELGQRAADAENAADRLRVELAEAQSANAGCVRQYKEAVSAMVRAERERDEMTKENAEHCVDFQAIAQALGILEELPDVQRVLERIGEMAKRADEAEALLRESFELRSHAKMSGVQHYVIAHGSSEQIKEWLMRDRARGVAKEE